MTKTELEYLIYEAASLLVNLELNEEATVDIIAAAEAGIVYILVKASKMNNILLQDKLHKEYDRLRKEREKKH